MFLKEVTTGAADDFEKVFMLAHSYVTKFGMCNEFKNQGIYESEYGQPLYSQLTSQTVDREIQALVLTCSKTANKVLHDKAELVKGLAKLLVKKETLNLDDIVSVLGPRPFQPKKNFRTYLSYQKEKKELDKQRDDDNDDKDDNNDKDDKDENE